MAWEVVDQLPQQDTPDRVDVPELDPQSSSRFRVVDQQDVPAQQRDIPMYDPKSMEVVDAKDVPGSAKVNPATTRVLPVAPQTLDMIKGFEGWDKGQWDYGQYSTGYGTRAKYPGEQISKEEADRRLIEELNQSANQVDSSLAKTGMKLTPNQRDALISFNYNLKPQPMPDGTLKPAGQMLIETSNSPEDIAKRLPQYNKAGGEVLPGLVQRRQDEANLFASGGYPSQQPQQPSTPSQPWNYGTGTHPIPSTGIPVPPPREYDEAQTVKDSAIEALQGFKGSALGLSEAASRYVYKPVFHGIVSAVDALAPNTDLAKTAGSLYSDFNKTFIDEVKTSRAATEPQGPQTLVNQVSRVIGATVPDLISAVVTGPTLKGLQGADVAARTYEQVAPTVFNIVKQMMPKLGQAAASFAIPALKSGMDAQDRAAQMGAAPADQNLAFWKAGLLTMGSAALPLGVESNAANMFTRFVQRAVKAVPLGVAASEATRSVGNILTPGEAQPFDARQLAINAIPIILMAGALGHNTRAKAPGPISTEAISPERPAPMPGGPVELSGDARFEPPRVYQRLKEELLTDEQIHDLLTGKKSAEQVVEEGLDPFRLMKTGTSSRPDLEGEDRGHGMAWMKALEQGTKIVEDIMAEEGIVPGATKVAPYEPTPGGIGIVAFPKAAAGAAEAVRVAKAIGSEAKTIKQIADFDRGVKNWVARKQLGAQAIMKMRREMDKVLKSKLRAEAITNYIQAGGDEALLAQRAAASKNLRLRQGYEAAANLTLEEKAIALKAKVTFADYLKRLNASGIEVAEFENYVNGMWQAKMSEQSGWTAPRTLSEYFRFKGQKFFKNYFEGEQAGYTPQTKDIRELLAYYMHNADTAINNRKLVQDLLSGKSKNGDPLLLNPGYGKVVEGEKGKPATLVFPNAAPKDAPEGIKYKRLDAPALRAWKWITKDSAGNSVMMKGDLTVHPEIADHLNNIFGQSWFQKQWNAPSDSAAINVLKGVTRFALRDAQQYFKGTLFSLSAFHQVNVGGQMFLGHRVNPFKGIPEIDLEKNPAQLEAVRNGLMLAPNRVGQQYFMEGVAGGEKNLVTITLRKLGEQKGLGVATKAANVIDGYTNYLFEKYIPGLAWKGYQAADARNMQRFSKEIAAGKITPEQIHALTADQINASTGLINKDIQKLGSNKTFQELLSMAFIAPHFGEARIRHALQAGSGLYSKKGWEQLGGLALTGATLWALARTVNIMNDHDAHFDHPFEARIGSRWYSMRSIPEDMYRATAGITGWGKGQGMGNFIANRLGPYSRAGVSFLGGYNYRGEKVGTGDLIKDTALGMVPMPIQGLTNKLTQSGKTDPLTAADHLLSSMGLVVHRYSPVSDVHTMATKWQEKNAPLTMAKGSFPPSKYTNLRYALDDGDRKRAAAEFQALLKDEKTSNPGLNDSKVMEKVIDGFRESMRSPYTSNKMEDARFKASLDAVGMRRLREATKRKALMMQRFDTLTMKSSKMDEAYFHARGQ